MMYMVKAKVKWVVKYISLVVYHIYGKVLWIEFTKLLYHWGVVYDGAPLSIPSLVGKFFEGYFFIYMTKSWKFLSYFINRGP